MTAARSVRSAATAAAPVVAPLVALVWVVAGVVAAAAGDYDHASWWLLLLNQLVLAPAAIVSALWLGGELGGRALGLLSALLLALLAPLGALFALTGYRDTYIDRVLTEAVGIGTGGRYPAAALSLVAAALAVRALADERAPAVAVLAGLVAAAAALSHPSGALVLVGIVLAYAVAWRPLAAGLVALAAVPGVAVAAVAYGAGLDVTWDAFTWSMTGLREYLWSNRLLQWLPLAGMIGAARASLPVALLLGGWFGAFAFVYGASPSLAIDDGSYLAAFVPALPAFCLLVACVLLLVPTLPRRLQPRVRLSDSS